MHLLLVTATAMEMRAVTSGLRRTSGAGGDIPERIVLAHATLHPLVCGIGPVSSAFALGRALGRSCGRTPEQGHGGRIPEQGPEPFAGVLNFGVAGTYDPAKAPLGSVALISEEIFPEYGLWTENGVQPEGMGFPQTTTAGGPVYDRIALDPEKSLAAMNLPRPWGRPATSGVSCAFSPVCLRGPGVTVAGVSGSPERAAYLAARTGGLVENMEGFSLALGCAALGLPFAEIRAVSNHVGFRPPENWNLPLALDALGRVASLLLLPPA